MRDENEQDPRATAKCSKCFDTGTVYENHGPGGGEAVNCEAPGCTAADPNDADTFDPEDETEAEAGRRIDEERNEQAGREINALAKLQAAGLDAATCSEEQAASIEEVGPLMAARLCRQQRRLAALGYVPD